MAHEDNKVNLGTILLIVLSFLATKLADSAIVAPIITPSPAATASTTNVEVDTGITVTFTCNKAATGDTPTSFEFYQGTTKLVTKSADGVTVSGASPWTYIQVTALANNNHAITCKAIKASQPTTQSTVLTLKVTAIPTPILTSLPATTGNPAATTILLGGTVKFTCTKAPTAKQNPVKYTFRNGGTLVTTGVSGAVWIYANVLVADNNKDVTCEHWNSDTLKTASNAIKIVTTPDKIPTLTVPTNTITATTAKIQWTVPTTPFDNIILIVRENGNDITGSPWTLLPTDKSKDLSSLNAGTVFTVTITTKAGSVLSAVTIATFTTTPDKIPTLTVPTNTITATTAKIQWTVPTTPFDNIILIVRENANYITGSPWTLLPTVKSKDLSSLNAGTIFTVTITTKAGSVLSAVTTATFTTTPDKIPTLTVPTNTITATTAKIQWTVPTTRFDNIILIVRENGNDITGSPWTLLPTVKSKDLSSLNAGTIFTVTITTKAGSVLSAVTTATFTTTPDKIPTLTVPTNTITATTAKIQWTVPTTRFDNIILIVRENGNDITGSPWTLLPTVKSKDLSSLNAGTIFTVTITTKAGSVLSAVTTATFTTTPNKPPLSMNPTGPVYVGAKVTLTCNAPVSISAYEWHRGTTKLPTTTRTLEITVKSTDNGDEYKCVAVNVQVSSVMSDPVKIIVYFKATVVLASAKTTSNVGDNDKFTCKATGGNPQVTAAMLKVYAKRSGMTTPSSIQNDKERQMMKEDNQAEFYCEAKVPNLQLLDVTSNKIVYTVTFPNTKVFFSGTPTGSVKVKATKKLTCETDGSNPTTTIAWYQYISGAWKIIGSGIVARTTAGNFAANKRISDLTFLVTLQHYARKYKCESTYNLDGKEKKFMAETALNVENVNECTTADNDLKDKCDARAECKDTPGSYICTCKTGFTGDGRSCQNIDECVTGQHTCHRKAKCEDTIGSYNCKCKKNWEGDGRTCNSVNKNVLSIVHLNYKFNAALYSFQSRQFFYMQNLFVTSFTTYFRRLYRFHFSITIVRFFFGSTAVEFEVKTSNDTTDGKTFKKDMDKYLPKLLNKTDPANCTFAGLPASCEAPKVEDVNECTSDPPQHNCDEKALCTNTDGSFTCRCITGYTGTGGTECTDIDECQTTNPNLKHTCHASAKCTNTPGSHQCDCNAGYSGDGKKTCDNVDECANANDHKCTQLCVDNTGSYTCKCKVGYKLQTDRQTCIVDTKCANPSPCIGGTCAKVSGVDTCSCKPGDKLDTDGKTCNDIKECAPSSGLNKCTGPTNSFTCTEETGGGYKCSCKSGYRLKPDGYTCRDIEECVDPKINCDKNSACKNYIGGYDCTCNAGFTGNAKVLCTDINECNSTNPDTMHNCKENATCENLPGKFKCNCKPGYIGNGTICENADECDAQFPSHNCAEHATCTDTIGSFTCKCKGGFVGNGTTCTDIDECAQKDTNDCAQDAQCKNEKSFYTCSCKPGYTGDGKTCTTDIIDECKTGKNTCNANANCTNTPGSYTCACKSGWYGNGRKCTDINECKVQSNCNTNANCTNTPGSFQCTCHPGYQGDGTGCGDVDECTSSALKNNCAKDAVCTNLPGNFSCACKDLYFGNGTTCKKSAFNVEAVITFTTSYIVAFADTNSKEFKAFEAKLKLMTGPCNNRFGSSGSKPCQISLRKLSIGSTVAHLVFSFDFATPLKPAVAAQFLKLVEVWIKTLPSKNANCNIKDVGDTVCGKPPVVTDIDECAQKDTNDCAQDAKCQNEMGLYACSCKPGYTGDGKTCTVAGEPSQSSFVDSKIEGGLIGVAMVLVVVVFLAVLLWKLGVLKFSQFRKHQPGGETDVYDDTRLEFTDIANHSSPTYVNHGMERDTNADQSVPKQPGAGQLVQQNEPESVYQEIADYGRGVSARTPATKSQTTSDAEFPYAEVYSKNAQEPEADYYATGTEPIGRSTTEGAVGLDRCAKRLRSDPLAAKDSVGQIPVSTYAHLDAVDRPAYMDFRQLSTEQLRPV